ncbi:MAG: hypothetical protein ABIA67_04100 [Candidatus Margulisiibacteriota bacterium]
MKSGKVSSNPAVKYVSFRKPLLFPKTVMRLPGRLNGTPKGAVFVEGHKLYTLSKPRRLLGFYVPEVGIFDTDGKRVLKIKPGNDNVQVFEPESGSFEMPGIRIRAVILKGSNVHLALDEKNSKIIGLFPKDNPPKFMY